MQRALPAYVAKFYKFKSIKYLIIGIQDRCKRNEHSRCDIVEEFILVTLVCNRHHFVDIPPGSRGVIEQVVENPFADVFSRNGVPNCLRLNALVWVFDTDTDRFGLAAILAVNIHAAPNDCKLGPRAAGSGRRLLASRLVGDQLIFHLLLVLVRTSQHDVVQWGECQWYVPTKVGEAGRADGDNPRRRQLLHAALSNKLFHSGQESGHGLLAQLRVLVGAKVAHGWVASNGADDDVDQTRRCRVARLGEGTLHVREVLGIALDDGQVGIGRVFVGQLRWRPG